MKNLLQRLTSWSLIAALTLQPVLAQAQSIVVQGSDNGVRPRVDTSLGGHPVLNISTPNSAGVSHDIYTAFTTGDTIVNNSAANTNTQLGGFIEGNPSLTPGSEAHTWIGEVVGGNQTQLTGILEVAGPSLDMVLANEFGITCDGCGFYNTNRTTLTTGKPVFNVDGSLKGFDVKRGLVTVGVGGLNPEDRLALGDTSRVDVIARAAALYGQMRANEANIIAGANVVDYNWSYDPNTGLATGITPQAGSGAVPALAVDVSALGGMYANAIKLIATEAGVGVRMNGEMASSSSIALSSSGRLSLGAPSAGRTPTIKAKRKVRVRAAGPILLEGSVTSEEGDLVEVISWGNDFSVTGEISGGAVTLQSAGLATINAAVTANQALTIASQNNAVVFGAVADLLAGSLAVNATTDITLTGIATTSRAATLTAGNAITIATPGQLGAGSANLSASLIDIDGLASVSSSLTMTAGTGGTDISGRALANDFALTSTGNADISGSVAGVSTLSIDATGALNTTATSQLFGDAVDLQGNGISLAGLLTAQNALTLSAGSAGLASGAEIKAALLNLVSAGDARLDGVADIVGAADLTVTGALSTVTGSGFYADAITANAQSVSFAGEMIAVGALTVTTNAAADITGIAAGKTATLIAGTDATVSGFLAGQDKLNVSVSGDVAVTAAGILFGADLDLNAASIDSKGAVLGTVIDLTTTTGDLTQGGTLIGETLALSSAAGIVHSGKSVGLTSFTASAADTLLTSATSEIAGGTLSLTADTLQTVGLITADEGLTLTSLSGDINNSAGLSGKSVTLNSAAHVIHDGILSTDTDARITAVGNVTTGAASGIKAADVFVTGEAVSNAGVIVSDAVTTLTARSGAIQNSGTVSAGSTLTLNSNTALVNSGTLLAATLDLTTTDALSFGSTSQIVANDLDITAASLNNAGLLDGKNDLDLSTTSGAFINFGNILGADVALTSASTFTNSGAVQSTGALTATAVGAFSSSAGAELIGQVVTLTGTDITNAGLINGVNATLTGTGAVSNSGTIYLTGLAHLTGNTVSITGRMRANDVRVDGVQISTGSSAVLDAVRDILLIASSGLTHNGRTTALATLDARVTAGNAVVNGTLHGDITKLNASGTLSLGASAKLIGQTSIEVSAAALSGGLDATDFSKFLTNGDLKLAFASGGLSVGASQQIAHSGNLALSLGGNITNNGTLKTSGHLELWSGGVITNAAGGILKSGGNMLLTATSLVNESALPPITTTSTTVVTNEGNPDETPYAGNTNVWHTITTTTTTQSVASNPAASKILASGNLVMVTNEITNRNGEFVAGSNITAAPSVFTNEPIELTETKVIDTDTRSIYGYCLHYAFGVGCKKRYRTTYSDDTETITTPIESFDASVTAGGNINISAGAVVGTLDYSAGASTSGLLESSYVAPTAMPTLALGIPAPKKTELPTLLVGSYKGLIADKASKPEKKPPTHSQSRFPDSSGINVVLPVFARPGSFNTDSVNELIEQGTTRLGSGRSALMTQEEFLTSNYLMDVDRLQYRDELLFNRQDGLPFIPSRFGQADQVLLQQSYDNAIGTEVGTNFRGPAPALFGAVNFGLTQDGNIQLAALTNERGAGDINITAGVVNLSGGTASATGAVTITGDQSLSFTSVKIKGASVALKSAEGDLTIAGSQISATDSVELAAGGNLDILALSEKFEGYSGEQGNRTHRVGNKVTGSSITAGGDFSAIAGKDLKITASEIDAKGSLSLEATNDIELAFLTETDNRDTLGLNSGVNSHSKRTDSVVTQLSSGKGITIKAGQDATLAGAQVTAGTTLDLSAARDVVLETAFSTRDSGWQGKKSGESSGSQRSVVTALSSGTSMSIAAESNVTLTGTKLDAGTALAISAGIDVTLLAAVIQDFERSNSSSGNFFRKTEKRDSRSATTYQGVSITSGGDTTVTAKNNLTTAGTTLKAGGSATLEATTGKLLVGTYEDKVETNTFRNKSILGGLLGGTSETKIINTTETATDALAALDLTTVSGGATELVGTKLEAGNKLTVKSGGDLIVKAAVSNHQKDHKATNNGLIVTTNTTEKINKDTAAYASFKNGSGLSFEVGGETLVTLYSPTDEPRPNASDVLPAELLALDGLRLLDGNLTDEYFFEETQKLSPAFKVLVSIAVTQGIGALGGGAGFAQGVLGVSDKLSWLASGIDKFAATFVVESLDAAVSGDIDLGEILGTAAFAGATAGLTSGINLAATDGGFLDFGAKFGEGSTKSLLSFGSDFGIGSGLTIQNLAERTLDNVLRSGLSSAVYGTDFGESFKAGLKADVVSLATADFQDWVGDQGLQEGSAPHAALHGVLGCGSSMLAGGNCASGAIGGAAQSVYAGTLGNHSNFTDAQKAQYANTAQLIGASAGLLFSEGKAENVSGAASIARSGFEHNYLSHEQLDQLDAEKRMCLGEDEACYAELYQTYSAQMKQTLAQAKFSCEHSFTTCARELTRLKASLDRQQATFENEYAGLVGTEHEDLARVRYQLIQDQIREAKELSASLDHSAHLYPDEKAASVVWDDAIWEAGMEEHFVKMTSTPSGVLKWPSSSNGTALRRTFPATNKAVPIIPDSALVTRIQAKMGLYPKVIDARTGREITFPSMIQGKTPKTDRVTWTSKERGAFIKEWYDRGHETPKGGWSNYDIHHIQPREFGGSNSFQNLVPIERGTHREFNKFWREFSGL